LLKNFNVDLERNIVINDLESGSRKGPQKRNLILKTKIGHSEVI
jgi:hypothetical protein